MSKYRTPSNLSYDVFLSNLDFMQIYFCGCFFADVHAILKMVVTKTIIEQQIKDTIAFGKLHRNVFCRA